MFQQLRSLFIGSPPPDDDVDDIDAGQFDNLPSEDDSLADRSRKLDYRNWSKPPRWRYVRADDLPAEIKAAADDGTLEPWGTDKTGQKWFKISEPIEAEQLDSYSVADDDDYERDALATLAALDAESEAIVENFQERCEAMIAERGDAFLPHSDWTPDDE